MARDYSTGEICQGTFADASPQIASLRSALCLDHDRGWSAFNQKCRCSLVLGSQRLQLPTCAIYDAQPVPVVDKNAKLGWLAVALNACGFEDAQCVLVDSVHPIHIGHKLRTRRPAAGLF